MYKFIRGSAFSLTLFALSSVSHAQLIDGLNLPFESVAITNSASSIALNPAGLGFNQGRNFNFAQSHLSDNFFSDTGVYFAFGNIGYSLEWLDAATSRRKHTFALALSNSPNSSIGFGYSRFGSDSTSYSALSLFTAGLNFRPTSWLSLAGVATDVRGSSVPVLIGSGVGILESRYRLGLGLRPLGEFLTLSADANISKFDSGNNTIFQFGLEYWSDKGFSINGMLDEDGGFEFGIEIGFPTIAVRNSNRYSESGAYLSSVSVLEMRNRRRATSLQQKGSFLQLKLSGTVPDEPTSSFFFRGARTTSEWVRLIDRARDDKQIGGIILHVGAFTGGMSTAAEIRNALLRFKSSGKKIIAYAEIMTVKGLYVASVAEKIYMNPSGYLFFAGLRAQVTHYKSMLEKIGIEAEFIRVGRYKSAVEPTTLDSMSSSRREELNAILDDFQENIYSVIADGRNLSREDISSAAEEGPYTTGEAVTAKLIDGTAYEDEIEDKVKELFGVKNFSKITGRTYEKQKLLVRRWNKKPIVAILHLSGVIGTGESRKSPLGGSKVLGAKSIARMIKSLRNNRNVKAIILRIDSGGGTTLGSDIIWREMHKTKGEKPLIVSFGDIAASGAYYLAMPADTILAEKMSLTGSIGIFMGKPSLKGLYKKLGISKEMIKRGKHSDIFSENKKWTDDERELLQRQLNELYDDFVNKVAEGRGLSKTEVDSAAMGRVWTGEDALELGLIDIIGGIRKAEDVALEMINSTREETKFVALSSFGGSGFRIGAAFSALSDRLVQDAIAPFGPLAEDFQEAIELLLLLQDDQRLSVTPYNLEIE